MRKSPDDVYRSCASIVVLRPADVCSPDGCQTLYQVLLVHKPRKRDAWQLPQGGRERGESVQEAALRELKEEAGIAATVFTAASDAYQYDFPASFRRLRPDNVCGQCIDFVFALAEKQAEVQVDGHEIDGFVWALPEELGHYIKRKQYLKLVEKLVADAISRVTE